ncbi:MAG: metallopeptidase family protein [Actinomycetota bacterium]
MKKEINLVNKRKARIKKLKVYMPSDEEFYQEMLNVVTSLAIKKHKLWKEAMCKNIQFICSSVDYLKYYRGLTFNFAEFVGQPNGEKTAIIVYKHDILVANYFQKDLVLEHLYYILEHEVAHYFGMKHEDLKPDKKLKSFYYPF